MTEVEAVERGNRESEKSPTKRRRVRPIPITSKIPLYDRLMAEKEERSVPRDAYRIRDIEAGSWCAIFLELFKFSSHAPLYMIRGFARAAREALHSPSHLFYRFRST